MCHMAKLDCLAPNIGPNPNKENIDQPLVSTPMHMNANYIGGQWKVQTYHPSYTKY